MTFYKVFLHILFIKIVAISIVADLYAQEKPSETTEEYYRIESIPIPDHIKLEVGGMQVLPNGNIAVVTRRGEIWIISNAYDSNPSYHRFAYGLHEPLGILYHNNEFFVAQRGELTRIIDRDNDGFADEFEAVAKFGLTGNYHQYFYGPILLENDELLISINLDLVDGKPLSKGLDWMGWALKITKDGKITPWATGMRSPAGISLYKGDLFFTENQGDWVGSGYLTHIEKGDFTGNPKGLKLSNEPTSPVKIQREDIKSGEESLYEVASKIPGFKKPAIWFPYTLMGISTSDFKEVKNPEKFGPFEGQLIVGDFGHSKLMRVSMEKVKGQWQGACFPFRDGLSSGVFRLDWGKDGSLIVGQTSRGWRSFGQKQYDLQRVVWTGKIPFEMKEINSTSDGFEITFTKPVDSESVLKNNSFKLNRFTYQYHSKYGSPVIKHEEIIPTEIYISDDKLKVGLVLKPTDLKKGFVYEIKPDKIKSDQNESPFHDVGYYTLNEVSDLSNSGKYKKNQFVSTKVEIETSHAHHHTAQIKRQLAQPKSWSNGPDKVITLKTKPGLKFDLENLHVKAGSKIQLKFINSDDMLHNLVITTPGKVDLVGDLAMKLGLKGEAMEYVPDNEEVLFHTGVLQPGTEEIIYFEAPHTPGKYHYLCTFPGHFQLMRGILNVVE